MMNKRFVWAVFAGPAFLAVSTLGGCRTAAPSQEAASPAAVETRVEARLDKLSAASGGAVQVAVAGKTVTLTGTVRTLADKVQAGEEAAAAARGYEVVNDLELTKTDLTLQQIAESVFTAIEKSPDYGIYDYVGVLVRGEGEAVLKGWVYYPRNATKFLKLAEARPGVTKVTNEIRPELMSVEDKALRLQVARLIYVRPKTSTFPRMTGNIHILVENGVVTLAGTVKNEEEVASYERLVHFNTNAVRIINLLRAREE
jgi:osmotically-inducible protein OsmY